ncbi:MAG: PDZ domain-containing protein [Elusimicrobiota bacterium]
MNTMKIALSVVLPLFAASAFAQKSPVQSMAESIQADLNEFSAMIEESRQELAQSPAPSLGIKFGTLIQGVFVSAVHRDSQAFDRQVRPGMMLLMINGVDLTQMTREKALETTLETIDRAEGEIQMTFMAPYIVEVALSKRLLLNYPEGFAARWEGSVEGLQEDLKAYSEEIKGQPSYVPFLRKGRALMESAHHLRAGVFGDMAETFLFSEAPSNLNPHRHPQPAPKRKHRHQEA